MSIHNATSLPPDLGEQRDAVLRKRKRDDSDTRELDRRPFTVQPAGSDPFARKRTFDPICLLSRAQLPLAYLDTAGAGSQLFASFINVLEACHEYKEETNVLIAEDERDKRLYAVEKAGKRVYALCRLGRWVTKEGLESASKIVLKPSVHLLKRQTLDAVAKASPWWNSAVVEAPCRPSRAHVENALRSNLSMLEVEDAPLHSATKPKLQSASATHADISAQTVVGSLTNDISTPSLDVSPQDILEDLSKQYLEALYLSRTSLAYFTKGPLSRARAAFSGQLGVDTHGSHLVSFLRETVLPAAVMDKKFRESLGMLVKDLPVVSPEKKDQPPKTRKKKKWKSKRDKSGMFGTEKDFLESWWRESDDDFGTIMSPETVDAALRRRLPYLRSRETYLQIILLLETLALEITLKAEGDTNSTSLKSQEDTQAQEEGGAESQAVSTTKKQKAKKPEDFMALLEILLDRLCIWHSLDSHTPAKKHGGSGSNGNNGTEEQSDELRSFCVEVIVPFYTSRLPKQAALVNKKLGGPSPPTLLKHQSSRRPGEPAVRHGPRKPLERVASEALNQSSKHMPTLHRSATDSKLPASIKREPSESLASMRFIPFTQPPPRRPTPKQAPLREVDFAEMSQANEAKKRKRAEMDEKVREAVAAARKPNRTLAVTEVAERADANFEKALSKTKSYGQTKKDRMDKAQHKVNVTATPSIQRQVAATPAKAQHGATLAPSHSSSVILSSSSRLFERHADRIPDSSAIAVPATGHRPRHATVGDTPSRRDTIEGGFTHRLPALQESPIAQRRQQPASPIQRTPSKPVKSLSFAKTPLEKVKQFRGIVGSPDVRGEITATPAAARTDSGILIDDAVAGNSIYDTLGWDDDYEELA